MSAPKIITMRLKRAPTKDGAVFIPYIERKDGQLFRMPIPKTQYTRSDLVEALVEKTDNYINANNALKSWRDDSNRNPSEYGKLNKAIQDAQHFCIEALKSLKALGE